jgi:hypothetical protein
MMFPPFSVENCYLILQVHESKAIEGLLFFAEKTLPMAVLTLN